MPDSSRPKRKTLVNGHSIEFRRKAVALANIEKNAQIAADVMGVNRSSICQWRKHPELNDPLEQAFVERNLADALDAMAWRLLDVMPDKMEDASLSQVAHALSVSIDKAQLLKGAPTSISSKPVDPQALRERIRDILLDKAKDNAIDTTVPLAQGGGGSREEWDSDGATDRPSTLDDPEMEQVTSPVLDFEE